MLVQKLVYDTDINFISEIYELRIILKKKDINIGIVESVEQDNHIVKLLCDDDCYNEKIKDIIDLYMSNVLYKIVIKEYKNREMFDYITENYFFLKQDEIIEVEEKIMKILLLESFTETENYVYYMNKINNIIEKIKEFLEENSEININGFIRFRMKELKSNIERVIDKVIENYMVEKEYKEFVKLLKYFVDIQESKIEEIDIFINEGGKYIIKNKAGKDIFNEFMKEIADTEIDTEAKMEDIIISGLITNAPRKVKIYGKDNCMNKEFLETIINVFEDRVELG
ncbi:putative sporulation protein YtxC [Clostridium isatidis]|uniref:Sporulation protein n=1 Tax=Clostridium isatidis TaxID=182773 RepID=A0A343JAR6_9CLOT|nr:putative sporulation protein YtxC [Clostridium isatidis]ASW42624.1 sporulation protein [Clostridium isatidis]